MNIHIKATNIELTDAIRNYVFKKLEGIDKLVNSKDGELVVHVEVAKTSNHHKSGDIFKAEVRIGIANVFAISEKNDLYSAIDDVRDEVIAEAKKAKGKKESLIRRGGQKAKNLFRSFLQG